MNYYVFGYGFSIVLSLVCGGLIFRIYRNLAGLFFFLFTCFVSLWFLLYFLFFAGITDTDVLLFVSRFDFGVGVGATYSLLAFIYFFDSKPAKIWSYKLGLIILGYTAVLGLHAFTPLIVAGLTYIPAENVYREIQGKWYPLNAILHITGVLLFILAASISLREQTYLSRIRLKRILYSSYLFMIVCLFLQLVLPTFGIWILEKEIILLFLAFVLYTFWTIRRYYFSSLGYGIGSVVVVIASIVVSIVSLNAFKFVYLRIKTGVVNNYWLFQDQYSIIDTIIGVSIFYVSYRMLHRIFLGNSTTRELKNTIQKLEQNLSHTTNLRDLNIYLGTEMRRIFKTQLAQVRIFPESDIKTELQKYFENDLSDKIFINDVVFIEEKKNKFHKEKLLSEIPEDAFLILPIFDRDATRNTGVFILGVKSFGDFYTVDEIDILRNFSSFLALHLKYIKTYAQIHDLSVNLDKKVDEKTIEYNNLINQQKEFISIISHEIKSPIATVIFQADSILDDLDQGDLSEAELKTELSLMNDQLIKTGDLLQKLFSVQYFDTHNVTLFKEKVQMSYLLHTEYDIYSRMHGHIRFINRIDDAIGFATIDRIQFQQVISNLLNNAVKFQDKEDPVIAMEAYKEDETLHVIIEDNGKGFQGIDVTKLFEKYTIGSGESVGLGMGLYLCKKIVCMHGGSISAETSEHLSGARFHVSIPLH